MEDTSKLSGDADGTLGYCCARPGNDTDCVCDEAQFRVKGECTTCVGARPRAATITRISTSPAACSLGFSCQRMEPELAFRPSLVG